MARMMPGTEAPFDVASIGRLVLTMLQSSDILKRSMYFA